MKTMDVGKVWWRSEIKRKVERILCVNYGMRYIGYRNKLSMLTWVIAFETDFKIQGKQTLTDAWHRDKITDSYTFHISVSKGHLEIPLLCFYPWTILNQFTLIKRLALLKL